MKKIFFAIVAVLILVSGIFVACNKGSQDDINIIENTSLKVASQAQKREITCPGSCNNGACSMKWDLKTGEITCLCEGCAMQIEGAISEALQTNMIDIANHFVDYVKRTHDTEDYSMTSQIQTVYDNSELIEINYIINERPDTVYSVVFVTSYTDKTTILVDCTGGCFDGSCVEIYNTKTGEVRCGCQSDGCHMKIEKTEHAVMKEPKK